jgi:Xaa-Pro aminopeptidase
MMECEFPFIETTSDIDLQQGMTFAADTYLAGENFGMRFEDTVAITAAGEEQYCDYRREVIQL